VTANDESELARMTIGEHLRELRSRLIKAIWAFSACFILALVFQQELMKGITWPHRVTMASSVRRVEGEIQEHRKKAADPAATAAEREEAAARIGDLERLLPDLRRGLVLPTFLTAFMAYMKLAFIAGVFAASPIIAWQLWAFVAAGLYRRERKWVYTFAPFSLLLFLAGCAFGFLVLIRYGLLFLAGYGDPVVMTPLFQLDSYLSLVLTLTIIMGALFELPLVMAFLSIVGLVEPRFWNQWRRHMIVAIVIVAAVLTPPDPVSQTLMAIPLWVLYELGVLFSFLLARRKAAERPATS
jgi:sec-independent protein translocase protein TatC